MLDEEKYLEQLENYFQRRGLTKLDEPEDTEDYMYCSWLVDSLDALFLVGVELAKAVLEAHGGKYYLLNVDVRGDVLYATSSRGNATVKVKQ